LIRLGKCGPFMSLTVKYEGEKGYITTDLLEKYLQKDLKECIFLVCGPPAMVTKLEAAMREAGVPDSQIQHELFL